MTDLINLKTNIDFSSDLKDILLSFCEHKIDMSFFKGSPETYLCNIQKFSQFLESSGRFEQIYLKGNRRPNENDPERTSKIVQYQQLNSIGTKPEEFMYDTADWKITFATINNKFMVVLDGQHRLLASKELPNIKCLIQILDFDNEDERFEKFKIINIASDLPDIYRMSNDDIYKKLGIILKEKIKELGWYVPKTYQINIDCGKEFNILYVIESEFINFVMKQKHIIFGKISDITNETLTIKKIIDTFIKINNEIINNIIHKSYGAGMYPNFQTKLKITNTQTECHGYNVSQKSRCTSKGKYENQLLCGHHRYYDVKYTDPDFSKIVLEIKKSGCSIGLLSESELEKHIISNFQLLT